MGRDKYKLIFYFLVILGSQSCTFSSWISLSLSSTLRLLRFDFDYLREDPGDISSFSTVAFGLVVVIRLPVEATVVPPTPEGSGCIEKSCLL